MGFLADAKEKTAGIELKLFRGGNDDQRVHLNEVVRWMQGVQEAIDKNNDPQNNGVLTMELRNVYITHNGGPVEIRFPFEYVEADI